MSENVLEEAKTDNIWTFTTKGKNKDIKWFKKNQKSEIWGCHPANELILGLYISKIKNKTKA